MTTTIELTHHERLAITMLQSNPEEFAKIAKNGQINLNDVLQWYGLMTEHLRWAEIKRRNEYIDISIIPQTVEEKNI